MYKTPFRKGIKLALIFVKTGLNISGHGASPPRTLLQAGPTYSSQYWEVEHSMVQKTCSVEVVRALCETCQEKWSRGFGWAGKQLWKAACLKRMWSAKLKYIQVNTSSGNKHRNSESNKALFLFKRQNHVCAHHSADPFYQKIALFIWKL